MIRHSILTALLALAVGPELVSARCLQDASRQLEFVLIEDGLTERRVQLVGIMNDMVTWRDEFGNIDDSPLRECVAMFDPDGFYKTPTEGLLRLADGQQLPGEAISQGAGDEEIFAWHHNWMGRLSIALNDISTLRLTRSSPTVEAGDKDQVLLVNGDRLDGLVVSLGNPIILELTTDAGNQIVEVPLNRVSALAMINPRVEAESNTRRIWFIDTTIIDVTDIKIGDDGYARIWCPLVDPADLPIRRRVEDIAAILFEPGQMKPLASLDVREIKGPASRYTTPEPRVLNPGSPLEISAIEMRGPLVARFALPRNARRFAAQAVLPRSARTWGDFDLVVRVDGDEVFSGTINGETPTLAINVPVNGSELTIELTEGRHGPIQDRVLLEGAMVEVGRP